MDEACANVILHATAADDYQVRATIADQRCSIDIVNAGASAFPLSDATPTDPAATAEHGRGLQIINAIVENLELNGDEHNATELHFENPSNRPADLGVRDCSRRAHGVWGAEKMSKFEGSGPISGSR